MEEEDEEWDNPKFLKLPPPQRENERFLKMYKERNLIQPYVNERFNILPRRDGKPRKHFKTVGEFAVGHCCSDWKDQFDRFLAVFQKYLDNPLPEFQEFTSVVIPSAEFPLVDTDVLHAVYKRMKELGYINPEFDRGVDSDNAKRFRVLYYK